MFVVAIEDSYEGPSLAPDGTVTEQFMLELMAWYKKQKVLHKKYAFAVISMLLEAVELAWHSFAGGDGGTQVLHAATDTRRHSCAEGATFLSWEE